MPGPHGENPMRHDCAQSCWRDRYCPNIEDFAKSLPRLHAFTDIDFYAVMTEVAHQWLILDWKGYSGDDFVIPKGQRLAWQRLTAELHHRLIVGVVTHIPDRPKMITGVGWITNGNVHPWRKASRGDLINLINGWADKAVTEAGGRLDVRPMHVAPFVAAGPVEQIAGFAPGGSPPREWWEDLDVKIPGCDRGGW